MTPWGVFRCFLRLGLTSFGGPVAHLGFFRQEFVARRGVISEADYAALVALAQVLPGPTSSQVGFALGRHLAGWRGACAAWCGFTLPSALLLALAAAGLALWGTHLGAGWLLGVEAVAAAVVAQALWGMGRSLTPDAPRLLMAAGAAAAALGIDGSAGQFAALGIGIAAGALLRPAPATAPVPRPALLRATLVAVLVLVLVPLALGAAAQAWPGGALIATQACWQGGAWVFGGGHVILPLLSAELVDRGHLTTEAMLAGYGLAQAVPGPLFTLAAFVGQYLGGPLGALAATLAIFLPGLALMAVGTPLWNGLRARPAAQRALLGLNAAVVGLLAAALIDPVLMRCAATWSGPAIALGAALLLWRGRLPVWLVVLLGAAAGAFIAR